MENRLISVILLIVLVQLMQLAAGSWSGQLKFNNDQTFRVFQMTDLHYEIDNVLINKNKETMKAQEKLLRKSKPNFVAFTGDLAGTSIDKDFDTFYQRQWYKYTFAVTQMEIPYAIALGNHDAQTNLNRTQIVQFDMLHGMFSMTKLSPKDVSGATNYYIPVYSSLVPHQVSLVMWFLDTKDMGCMGEKNTYGCVEPDQIAWFESQYESLKTIYGSFMSVVFLHIPLPEYTELLNTEEVYGNYGEQCCCPTVNSGFFKSLVDRKVRGVFCGHDHRNDFGGFLDGVELVYGRKTGYNSYGPSSFNHPFMMKGGTELNFKESLDKHGTLSVVLKHRVLLEDGVYRPDNLFYRRYFSKKQTCKKM